MAVEGAERFDISNVVSRTFSTIAANFLLFFALSLVLVGIPTFLSEWLQTGVLMGADPTKEDDLEYFMTGEYWWPVLGSFVLGIVTNAMLQASLTRATVMHLSGERPAFGPLLALGLSMILPMIAIGLLSAIGMVIGFMLLIVPGVILWLAWIVVAPVFVQERTDLFAAFGRSMELTQGARWKILLLVILLTIGVSVASAPLLAIVAVAGNFQLPLLVPLLSAMVGAVGSMISVTLTASIYVELREAKEGVAPDELETIFA